MKKSMAITLVAGLMPIASYDASAANNYAMPHVAPSTGHDRPTHYRNSKARAERAKHKRLKRKAKRRG